MDLPRPVPQLIENLALPVVRRTLFGMRQGPTVNLIVRLCFHPDGGFWLECPAGVNPAELEAQHAPALAEARARMLKDQTRRSTITATYLRQKNSLQAPADPLRPSATQVDDAALEVKQPSSVTSLTRHDRETTTEKLRHLRAKQSPGSDRITRREPQAIPIPIATPAPLLIADHDTAIDVFSAIDAAEAAHAAETGEIGEAAPAPRSGTSPFRHDKTEITARIKALRERRRTPQPSEEALIPGLSPPRDEGNEALTASPKTPPT